jgi:hypothetical protein
MEVNRRVLKCQPLLPGPIRLRELAISRFRIVETAQPKGLLLKLLQEAGITQAVQTTRRFSRQSLAKGPLLPSKNTELAPVRVTQLSGRREYRVPSPTVLDPGCRTAASDSVNQPYHRCQSALSVPRAKTSILPLPQETVAGSVVNTPPSDSQ